MGYGMRMRESSFRIKAGNKGRALELARTLLGLETVQDSSGPHFSWVDRRSMEEAASIEEMLREWRWEPELNDDGDVVGLGFEGEKLGDDVRLWEAIAPSVEDGSFLEMVGEDGCIWRWWFDGLACEEQHGKVVFE